MKKTVALIFAGEGKEKRISEKTAENLLSMIDEDRYKVIKIAIDEDGSWFISKTKGSLLDGAWKKDRLIPTYPVRILGKSGFISAEEIITVDCAIPALHGDFGEDGIIAGALEAAHIPFVGQSSYAAAICADKSYTKTVSTHLGIPTAKWIVSVNESLHYARERAENEIGYPMFIKPARLGSSIGAYPIKSREQFDASFAEAKSLSDGRILIEELIDANYELECAFLETDRKLFSPSGLISTSGGFYDFNSKYQEDKFHPAVEKINGEIREKITEYSRLLCDYIGVRHLSRLDFFVTGEGKIYFNEINTFPGMTKTSLYPLMTREMGFAEGEFINTLIEKVIGK